MTLRLSVRRASGTWDPKSKGSPVLVATFAFPARDRDMAVTRVADLHLVPGIWKAKVALFYWLPLLFLFGIQIWPSTRVTDLHLLVPGIQKAKVVLF